ncbi:MAG: NAD(P)-binding domain-containing protein [Planctomycetota bacterium]
MVSLTLIGSDARAVRPSRLRALSDRQDLILDNLRQLRADGAIQGGLLISTCNRVEALIHATDPAPAWTWTERLFGMRPDFTVHAYEGRETVDHLLRVTAGLESTVLGEGEILGQVRRAFQDADDQGLMSKPMHRLRTRLFSAARGLRSRTGLQQRAKSVASVGANRLLQAGPRLAILGAGETGELALESLIRRGVSDLLVINRTLSRAQELAARYGVRAMSLQEFQQDRPEVNGLLCAVHSPSPIVDQELARALQSRGLKSIVDVSQPSVVASAVRTESGLEVLDLDDLAEIAAKDAAELEGLAEIGRAEARLQAEHIWRDLIAERMNMGRVVDLHVESALGELERALCSSLRHLDTDDQERLRQVFERLAKKHAHFHVRDLKELTGS